MEQKLFCHFCGHTLTDRYWEGRTRRFCERCDRPIYENPVPAACLILLDEADRLLLVRRSIEPKLGWWCLPGGFMEMGETPEQTALRELKEETGLEGHIDHIVGAASNASRLYGTVALFCYCVRKYSGDPVAGDDAAAVHFFHRGRLPEIAFESHIKFINAFYGR
ncbi:hypothetical protein DENIS_0744 [Desulfonema ishimotonii]|uniref:Nudix hydrolase domain-containing protein n=1 Tax=Desulfonema ishimotonii TaxID=45657 RepID=A0A401FS75_9BACT|nr:NUDIX hydrolase [Desulfonema ishimotonii]GBC59803.1 hypothetical protein DENIS_0744 [Desulfonema ishimotonii]